MVSSTLDRRVVIDLEALSHNFAQTAGLGGSTTRVMPAIKADAYGHGLIGVAKRLIADDAAMLAVARLDEAEELRMAGISVPVIMLAGIMPEEAVNAIRLQTIPFLYDIETARAISTAALDMGIKAGVILKIDTGMGRLGFPFDEFGEILEAVKTLPGLALRGLTSHLAWADSGDKSHAMSQIKAFTAAVTMASDMGYSLDMSSLANSAGLIDLPDTPLLRTDCVASHHAFMCSLLSSSSITRLHQYYETIRLPVLYLPSSLFSCPAYSRYFERNTGPPGFPYNHNVRHAMVTDPGKQSPPCL